MQIKTGSEPVDLQALADARADDETDTYAFATSGSYLGDPVLVDEIIGRERCRASLLSTRGFCPCVRTWVELAGS